MTGTTEIDLKKLELWCYDAAECLSKFVDADLTASRRATIARYTGKKRAILTIASDLAEGISHLPDEDRSDAQRVLKANHGFGYEYFQQRMLRVIDSILKNGKISSMSQYEKALDFLSDTTNEHDMLVSLSEIVAAYEVKLSKKRKQQ
ncbi:hypothetical protein [Luteimonas aquatica]|uniref:hypothetical protein n=1 Tax=Luteimonas aquatica TaxID=450364 RepID=UPI001F5AD778|nr:hypothetical protein [Luteimonas aquatica]